MRKAKQYINPLILGSAIFIALLFSISTFVYYIDIYISKGQLTEDAIFKLRYTLWSFFNTFAVFYFIVIFNYSWKNTVLKDTKSKKFIVQLIVSNIILIFGLNFLSLISIYNFEIWGKYSLDFTLYEYLIKIAYVNSYTIFIAYVFAYIMNLYKKSKTAEIESIKLKEEKMRAELASLKEQISPHFFFNTLSSLSSIIRLNEKNESLEFVDNLSEVYRYILESNQNDLVKLKDELEFLNAYLFLLDKRFGKKLILEVDISPGLYETSIPPMALQLLAENAIQHNTITSLAPLKIRIFTENDMICVQNNLQKKVPGESMGIGLPNLVKRYQLIASKEIIINENTNNFSVKLPIIKK